jgi:ring-1,2-phenylacetyl-CoA epoxidase subunit PaaD
VISTQTIYAWLEEVKDPEIPVLSLVDLGIIRGVEVNGLSVRLVITPTFVGCPALEIMKQEIHETLTKKGMQFVEIVVSYAQPWSSDDISEKGRKALKSFGLAPPPHSAALVADLDILEHAECPRCGGSDTELKGAFGATLCRSMHYCNNCREAFEQFKPL